MGSAHQIDETAYIKERLDDQINWYDIKSQICQSRFKRLRLCEIVFACSLPFLVGLPELFGPYSAPLIALVGVAIAILSGALALYKFEQNWIEYRTTCESLKHQRFLYITGTEPYDQEDAFNRLVLRVENLISKQNSDWTQSSKQPGSEGKP
jgi:uncharacterized protein DUF4231